MATPILAGHLYHLIDSCGHMDVPKLFCAYFNQLPSIRKLQDIDTVKMSRWMEDNKAFVRKYSSTIDHKTDGGKIRGEMETNIYILEEAMIIKLETNWAFLYFLEEKREDAEKWVSICRAFPTEDGTNHIELVIANLGELDTQRLSFRKPESCLQSHYNDDLQAVHHRTLHALREENSSGLFLFHGTPGTGKSTYIRSLICELDKDVVFITPELAGNLGSPEITSFLVRKANAVFVIEDAEQLLVSREGARNSSISTILNLTDGILGESLGIQIIATFNCNLQHIDKALLRKGRMRALYEFKPLSVEKSRALLHARGHVDAEVRAPMTLADIYHYPDPEFQVGRSRAGIGFKMG